MYGVTYTNRFKKALKKCSKRGLNLKTFEKVIDILRTTGAVPLEYRPHKLNAKFNFAWECHIEPDWLFVWEQNDNELTLIFIDTGTHSDIFG